MKFIETLINFFKTLCPRCCHSHPAPEPEPGPKVSFADDIMPLFKQYQARMMWRFNLTHYEDVKGNAALIWDQISSKAMPPPPFSPLNDEQIALFKLWMEQGCPP